MEANDSNPPAGDGRPQSPLELATYLADTLSLKLAEDVTILDVEALVGYTSYFVVASGRSERQVKALAEHLERAARTHHRVRPLGREGVAQGRWALVDFGDVVVHVFQGQERFFYDLEGLWEDAPRVPYTPPDTSAAAAAAR